MTPETITPIVFKVSAMLLIYAIGLNATLQDVTYLFRKPRELFRAFLAVDIVMPVYAVALAFIFDLHPAVKVGLIAISLSPVPPVMPPKLTKAGGTQSYAYGVVVAIGMLAIVFVPAAMAILGVIFNIPLQTNPLPYAVLIFVTIVIPFGLGLATRRVSPAIAQSLAKHISRVATLVLVGSLFVLVFLVRADIWSMVGGGIFVALVAFVLVGIAVGHFLGGPSPENRVALAISTGSRHPAIALAIAHVNFPDEPILNAVVILFLPLSAVFTIPYLIWSKKQRVEAQVEA